MENFKHVWQNLSADEKRAMAKDLDTNKDYLSQIAHGHRNAGKHFKPVIEAYLREIQAAAWPVGPTV